MNFDRLYKIRGDYYFLRKSDRGIRVTWLDGLVSKWFTEGVVKDYVESSELTEWKIEDIELLKGYLAL